MNHTTIKQLRRRFRQVLAATLFICLLFGASAAALSAFAAGIGALSGMRGAPVAVVGNTQSGVSEPTVTLTGSSYVNALNHRLDHLESPIGHTLDSGGVALGEKVQKSFGRVLSGVLETLFFERGQTDSATGGQP